jgi:hypothetical protein
MMNLHTIPIHSMNLITTTVVLLHGELVQLNGEVVDGAGVHVLSNIDQMRVVWPCVVAAAT